MFTFWAKVIAHPELTLTRGRRLSGTTWDKAASVEATSPGDVSKAICLQALSTASAAGDLLRVSRAIWTAPLKVGRRR